MRLRITQLLVFVLTVLYLFVPATASDSKPVILIFGDSLSAGYGVELNDTWVALLQQKLDAKGYGYRLVNASISGNTSGNGLKRLPRALELHRPDIVIIELGSNDGLRGLPVEATRDNLAEMIRQSQASGATTLLAGMLMPPNYGDEYTVDFAAVFPQLAEEFSTPFIPFFLKNVALDPSKLQEDGLHPNEDAQPIILETVWETLEPELAGPAAGQAISAS